MYIRCVRTKFGHCKKLFSWLGQKVNKKIDRYMLPLRLQELGRCTTHGELVQWVSVVPATRTWKMHYTWWVGAVSQCCASYKNMEGALHMVSWCGEWVLCQLQEHGRCTTHGELVRWVSVVSATRTWKVHYTWRVGAVSQCCVGYKNLEGALHMVSWCGESVLCQLQEHGRCTTHGELVQWVSVVPATRTWKVHYTWWVGAVSECCVSYKNMEGALHTVSWCGEWVLCQLQEHGRCTTHGELVQWVSVVPATRTWKVHYTRWVGAVSQCCVSYKNMEGALHMVSWCGESVLCQLQEHGRCTTHGELVRWVCCASYKNMEGALHTVSWCGESVLCQLQEHGRCTTHGELVRWVSVVSATRTWKVHYTWRVGAVSQCCVGYKNLEGALHTVSWCGESVLWQLQEHGRCTTHGELVRWVSVVAATRTRKVHYTRWVGAVSQCCASYKNMEGALHMVSWCGEWVLCQLQEHGRCTTHGELVRWVSVVSATRTWKVHYTWRVGAVSQCCVGYKNLEGALHMVSWCGESVLCQLQEHGRCTTHGELVQWVSVVPATRTWKVHYTWWVGAVSECCVSYKNMEGALHTVSWCGEWVLCQLQEHGRCTTHGELVQWVSVVPATRTWKVHYTRWVGAVSQCCVSYKNMEGALHMVSWCGESVLCQLQEHGRCTTHGELVRWVCCASYKNMEGALHTVSWCGESVLCQLQEHGRCTTHGELVRWVSVVSATRTWKVHYTWRVGAVSQCCVGYKNLEGALHTVSWCGESVLWQLQEHGRCTTHGELVRWVSVVSATRTRKVHYTWWVGAVSQCCASYKNMEGALHTVSWCGESVLCQLQELGRCTTHGELVRWVSVVSATRTWKVHYTRWVGAVSQCCVSYKNMEGALHTVSWCSESVLCQLQELGRCTTHGELVQWVSVVSATRTWKVHYTRWVGAVSQCCVSYKNMEGALHMVSWCGESVLGQLQEHGKGTTQYTVE